MSENLNSFKETTNSAAEIEIAVLTKRLQALTVILHGDGSVSVPAPSRTPVWTVEAIQKSHKRRGRPAGSKNKAKAAKPVAAASEGGNGNGKAGAAAPVKATITAKQRKARKLQGQFLGLIRQIQTDARPKYKAM